MKTHYLDDSISQPFWDNSVKPRLVIEPGDTVVFECLEASGQYSKKSTIREYLNVDRSKVHALNGSVYVNGAEPGDALEVEILDMQHKGWGGRLFDRALVYWLTILKSRISMYGSLMATFAISVLTTLFFPLSQCQAVLVLHRASQVG
ncbi:MAG: hypothetical protein ACJAZF_002356 [Granulosicoccus sp.]|jgi:hypothetical protein